MEQRKEKRKYQKIKLLKRRKKFLWAAGQMELAGFAQLSDLLLFA